MLGERGRDLTDRAFTIGTTRITDESAAYVIAEIGCNHQGSVETCKQMILAAARAGADAVKLQKRDLQVWAERDPRWHEPYHSENAFGTTYGEHRAALEFGWDEYCELRTFADDHGLAFFATAFDLPSLDFLARLGVPAIKLASASIVDLPLLDACAALGLPVIASTGGAPTYEISVAVSHLASRSHYTRTPLALMHCVATYPTQAQDMNLFCLNTLRAWWPQTVIGLSDHFAGISLAPVAYVLGARIFEKHFTLSRAMKGSDHAFSLEPEGLRKMIRDLHRTKAAMGDGIKRRLEAEVPSLIKMGRTDLARELVPS